jgi:pSer/pThr/pTyr-binding forkhead associated (FHA) protein
MDPVHLMVVRGDDTGKAITVPAAGARLGRSSKNDIVLADPSLSRHHCRF